MAGTMFPETWRLRVWSDAMQMWDERRTCVSRMSAIGYAKMFYDRGYMVTMDELVSGRWVERIAWVGPSSCLGDSCAE